MNEYVPMDWTNQESCLKALAGEEICLNSKASRLIFGPTQTYIYWVVGALYPWVMCPDHEAHHLPPSSAEVGMSGTVPLLHMPLWHVQRQLYCTLPLCFFTHTLILEYLCQDYILCCMQLCQIFFLRITDMCDWPYVTHHSDIPAMNKFKVCWGLGY